MILTKLLHLFRIDVAVSEKELSWDEYHIQFMLVSRNRASFSNSSFSIKVHIGIDSIVYKMNTEIASVEKECTLRLLYPLHFSLSSGICV